MSILIGGKKAYYEIPENVLKKCKITKAKFEKLRKTKAAEVAGQEPRVGHACSCSYASFWASCR
jgi:hypothetical protein